MTSEKRLSEPLIFGGKEVDGLPGLLLFLCILLGDEPILLFENVHEGDPLIVLVTHLLVFLLLLVQTLLKLLDFGVLAF